MMKSPEGTTTSSSQSSQSRKISPGSVLGCCCRCATVRSRSGDAARCALAPLTVPATASTVMHVTKNPRNLIVKFRPGHRTRFSALGQDTSVLEYDRTMLDLFPIGKPTYSLRVRRLAPFRIKLFEFTSPGISIFSGTLKEVD